MNKIIKSFPLGRIIKVIEATKFITTREAAKRASIDYKQIKNYKQEEQTNVTEATLKKITDAFDIPLELLQVLKELAEKLETYLIRYDNIPDEKRELLILQALAYKLLRHYLSQTDTQEILFSLINYTQSPNQKQTKLTELGRIIKVLIGMNFISTTDAATLTGISRCSINNIKFNKTAPKKATLSCLTKGFNVSPELLKELKQLEQELEIHFKKQANIPDNSKELLILQALSLKLLDYCNEQATKQYYYPEYITSTLKR